MANNQPIVAGQFQNPYKEFSLQIPAGGNEFVYYDHVTFRVMALSGGALSIRFLGAGSTTSVINAGIGMQHNEAIRGVQLFNTHPSDPLTVTVALSMGKISDDRLSVSGAISVANTEITPLWVNETRGQNPSNGQVSVDTTATSIIAANPDRKQVAIEAGAADLFIGNANTVTAANGFRIPAGTTFVFDDELEKFGIRAAGTFNCSFYETEEP